jgi:MscS family membrane protein
MMKRPCGLSLVGGCVLAVMWPLAIAAAQPPGNQSNATAQPQAQSPVDPLGRETPRGSVMGFLAAARGGDFELAGEYLDTTLKGANAAELTRQLFVVLDARLPARVRQVSGDPDGSRANPLRPNEEVVGSIAGASGDVDVILDRVSRGNSAIWLFSRRTLDVIPAVYEEVAHGWGERFLPRFLTAPRPGGIRLVEWIVVILGVPFVYLVTVLLNRILTPLIRLGWKKFAKQSDLFDRNVLPRPVRLLILAVAIRWTLSRLPLPLLARQFWSNLASLLIIIGIVWLLMLLSGEAERFVRRRFPRSNLSAPATLLRVGRRVVDVLVVFGGLLALLRHYGIDATPALAGLGVGGIAVALAAQKTLENVIAGASLIFDQAVRVGDSLKMGEVVGTVDHIGLRSTRIRTPDRTIISIPNGQIANMSLETLSARDMYWFHPVIGIRCETTSRELRAVVDGIRELLETHASVQRESVRVRFVKLGEYSLDVDVFAYVSARDWNHFLEVQEALLFAITEVVEAAGTGIAFRPQPFYVAGIDEQPKSAAHNAART